MKAYVIVHGSGVCATAKIPMSANTWENGVMQWTLEAANEYAARFTRIAGMPCEIVELTRDQIVTRLRKAGVKI